MMVNKVRTDCLELSFLPDGLLVMAAVRLVAFGDGAETGFKTIAWPQWGRIPASDCTSLLHDWQNIRVAQPFR